MISRVKAELLTAYMHGVKSISPIFTKINWENYELCQFTGNYRQCIIMPWVKSITHVHIQERLPRGVQNLFQKAELVSGSKIAQKSRITMKVL